MQTHDTLSEVSLSFFNTILFSTSYVLKLSLSSVVWDSLYIYKYFAYIFAYPYEIYT